MKILYGHTSEDTAKVVDNYPWGYKMRTQRRYWIETKPKKGDRFVYQTLDPRTNKWCKPKRGTYDPVTYMIERENGHIGCGGITRYSKNIKEQASKLELNEHQQNQVDHLLALNKVMENVTFTMTTRKFKHRETGEITESVPIFDMKDYYEVDEQGQAVDKQAEEEKEKETMKNINRGYAYELNKIKKS